MPGHLLEHILEHGTGFMMWAVTQDAMALRLGIGGAHLFLQRRGLLDMALLAPFAETDEMLLEPLDRVAQRPELLLIAGPVARGVIAGRVRGDAVGEQLDQG